MTKKFFYNLAKFIRHGSFTRQSTGVYPRLKVPTTTKAFLAASAGLFLYKCSFHKKFYVMAKERVTDKSIIEEADKLYSTSGNLRNLYNHLKYHETSTNSDILWRLARAARDLALKSPDVTTDEKKKLVYEAFECSKRALDADEKNFAAHKWYAITIGDVGDYEGVKIKISNAYVIRDHLERAIELNPNDATTLHCLGMWCFVFADMPRWQHMIAGVIFGTPPTSSYKEASEMFMQAERVDPNFYSVNLLMLGKSYMKMKDTKRAMLYLDRAIHYPVLNSEDEGARDEAELLLKELLGNK